MTAFDRADGIVAIATEVLRGRSRERSPIELTISVSAETLRDPPPLRHAEAPEELDPSAVACFLDGTCISSHAARRLGCDCGVVNVVEDERGIALSVGRRFRTIPGAMKRALLRRDRTHSKLRALRVLRLHGRVAVGTSYRAAIVAWVAQDFGLPQLLRRRLKAQADLFAALTLHPTLIGTGREDALAELFRHFMPRRFEIREGTVAIVDANQRPTRSTNQLDMIVADTMDFPTLLRSGNVAVVLAQSVRAVMEVKSNLKRGASFISALVQIARARQLLKPTDPVFIGMFSFGAPTNPDTLRDWIDDAVALRFLLATKQGDPKIEKLRDELLNKDDDHGIGIVGEDDLLAVLANSNLPDVIAADQGAIARKIGGPNGPNLYKFLGGGEDVPTVMVLIDQFVEQLGTSATPSVQGALAVLRAHLAIDLVVDPSLEDLQLPEPTPPSNVAS